MMKSWADFEVTKIYSSPMGEKYTCISKNKYNSPILENEDGFPYIPAQFNIEMLSLHGWSEYSPPKEFWLLIQHGAATKVFHRKEDIPPCVRTIHVKEVFE